jgi:hypothetical protein
VELVDPETVVNALPSESLRPKGLAIIVAFGCILAGVVLLGLIWPRILVPSIVGSVAAGGTFLGFKRPRLFLCFVVAYFFCCGLLKKTFSEYVIVFFLRDILLAFLYLVWFFKYPLGKDVRGRYDKFVLAAVAGFILYTLAVTFIPFTDEPFVYRLGGARWWLAFIPLFFVGADALDTPRRFDLLCRVFLGLAAVTAAYGIAQYAFGFEHLYGLSRDFQANVEWGIWYGVDAPLDLRTRVFSTFDLATTFAAMLRVACITAVAYFLRAKKVASSVAVAVLLVVCFGALLLTGTRAAYAPLFIGLATYAVLEPRRRKMAAVAVALAVGFALVMMLSSNVYLYRVMLLFTDYHYTVGRILWDWEKAVSLVRDFPFGLGISTSAKTGKYIDPVMIAAGWEPTYRFIEHGFGQALVSLGWPGLALFAAMFATVLVRVGRLIRVAPESSQWIARLVFVLCFSELFPLFTHASLNFGLGPVMFWLLSGSAIAICGRRSTREARRFSE